MKEITKYILSAAIATLLLAACSATKDITKPITKIDSKKNLNDAVVQKYKNTITPADLSKHLYKVASDGFEGRNTASRGLKMAADYITDFYKEIGLVGPVKDKANPYLQPIPFYEKKVLGAK